MKFTTRSIFALALLSSAVSFARPRTVRADDNSSSPAEPAPAPNDPKVTITSFEFPSARTRTAEVCGKVENATLPAMVRLEVDYDSDYQVPYNVAVGDDGLFCTVVVSLKSRARGKIWYMPGATATP